MKPREPQTQPYYFHEYHQICAINRSDVDALFQTVILLMEGNKLTLMHHLETTREDPTGSVIPSTR